LIPHKTLKKQRKNVSKSQEFEAKVGLKVGQKAKIKHNKTKKRQANYGIW